jgi:hypothetical protein
MTCLEKKFIQSIVHLKLFVAPISLKEQYDGLFSRTSPVSGGINISESTNNSDSNQEIEITMAPGELKQMN